MTYWTGFADLTFSPSNQGARGAFWRAVERAGTEAYEQQREAWLVDDVRVSFALSGDTPPSVLEGTRRILEALVAQASAGEAVVEVFEGVHVADRWVCKASNPSVSREISVPVDAEEAEDDRETIRTEAG